MSRGKKGGAIANNTNKKNHVEPFGISIISPSRARKQQEKKPYIDNNSTIPGFTMQKLQKNIRIHSQLLRLATAWFVKKATFSIKAVTRRVYCTFHNYHRQQTHPVLWKASILSCWCRHLQLGVNIDSNYRGVWWKPRTSNSNIIHYRTFLRCCLLYHCCQASKKRHRLPR